MCCDNPGAACDTIWDQLDQLDQILERANTEAEEEGKDIEPLRGGPIG